MSDLFESPFVFPSSLPKLIAALERFASILASGLEAIFGKPGRDCVSASNAKPDLRCGLVHALNHKSSFECGALL